LNRFFIALGKLSRIFYYLQHPQENPQIAVVALGILVVVGLLIAAGLFLVYVRITAPPKKKSEGSSQRRLKRYVVIGLAVLAVGLITATYESRNPKFCASCHINNDIDSSWKKSPHKNISCYKCHQPPGFLGFVEYLTRGSANLATYYRGGWDQPIRGFVDDAACLRCHGEIEDKTVNTRGIAVSHKEIIANGQSCSSCHGGVGHEQVAAAVKSPTMEQCISCHNGEKASAKCSVCHTVDVAKTAKEFGKNYANAPMPELKTCNGCHKPKTAQNCIKCMGFELPHPEGWAPIKGAPAQFQVKPIHPPIAFKNFEKCMKCHSTKYFCNNCHRFPDDNRRNHGYQWLINHQKQGKNPTCGCHRSVPSNAWCQFCHGKKFDRKYPGDLKYYFEEPVK
jgi:nitrate/TMAO reductase-like tetraheme cytochrome c subunit